MKNPIKLTGIIFFILAIAIHLFSHYPTDFKCAATIKEMYPNLSSEFVSIAITILLINYLYDKKAKETNKKRLLRELGSEDKGFTSRALKEIKELGYLTDGTLKNVDLTNANLDGLDFAGAVLDNACFDGASLNGTVFKNAKLNGANMDGVQARKADFENCSMDKVSLKNANLYNAILNRSIIAHSDMLKINLSGCEMIDTQLTKTKLEDAILSLSVLTRTKIIECNLTRIDIAGSNIKLSLFERCNLEQSTGWENTIEKSSANFNACSNQPSTI